MEATSGSDDDQFLIVADEMFDESTQMFIGETQFGTLTGLSSGYYGMSVPAGGWQVLDIHWVEHIDNGMMIADLELAGGGAGGTVARSVENTDGTFSFYVCWINSNPSAGCHFIDRGEWIELYRAPEGSIQLQTLNELLMYVAGDTLVFEVNGVEMTRQTVTNLAPGAWGLFGEGFDDGFTAWWDRVTLIELLR